MTEETLRGLVVYLSTGVELVFKEATAYSLTGPSDRDLHLVDWDWENHKLRRQIAYFPAGGWIGFRWGDMPNSERGRMLGFKLPKVETDTVPADPRP